MNVPQDMNNNDTVTHRANRVRTHGKDPNMQNQPITVSATVNAPLALVWQKWTTPQDVMGWNNASDDWYTPSAQNDLRVGGMFHYMMASRNGNNGFDFSGVYTEIIPEKSIAYMLGDSRKVHVTFTVRGNAVIVTETFDPEQANAADLQRAGWQAILDNFKAYVEKS